MEMFEPVLFYYNSQGSLNFIKGISPALRDNAPDGRKLASLQQGEADLLINAAGTFCSSCQVLSSLRTHLAA